MQDKSLEMLGRLKWPRVSGRQARKAQKRGESAAIESERQQSSWFESISIYIERLLWVLLDLARGGGHLHDQSMLINARRCHAEYEPLKQVKLHRLGTTARAGQWPMMASACSVDNAVHVHPAGVSFS